MGFFEILSTIALALVPATGAWITSRLRRPTDFQRASLISQIARSMVGLVLVKNPNSDPAMMLALLTEMLIGQIPTGNRQVAERAAAEALLSAGVVTTPTAPAPPA